MDKNATAYQIGDKVYKTFSGFERYLLKLNPVATRIIQTPIGQFLWDNGKAQLAIPGARKVVLCQICGGYHRSITVGSVSPSEMPIHE